MVRQSDYWLMVEFAWVACQTKFLIRAYFATEYTTVDSDRHDEVKVGFVVSVPKPFKANFWKYNLLKILLFIHLLNGPRIPSEIH